MDQLGEEMNQMFKELQEMESMIAGNRDLKTMESLMDSTKEVVSSHVKAYDSISKQILKIN